MLKKLLCLIACAANLACATPIYTDTQATIHLTQSQPTFIIKLNSNPTTGYSWALRSYDKNLLTPINHLYQAPQNTKLIGAPGYELWTFKLKPTASAQSTTVEFVYRRPWEKQPPVSKTVFHVEIEK